MVQTSARLTLEAAHFNHRLRGKDSDQDENFCRELCTSLKIPLRIGREESAVTATSEEALRERRYAFLQNEALSGLFDVVMTAHTANDQAETLLFRLIRGTSVKGLGGIKACRPFAPDVVLLRPLLYLSRDEVLAFLSEQKVTAREDLSNSQLHYARNFIRKLILEPVEQRFAGAIDRIAKFAIKAAGDNDFIEQQARSIFEQLNLHHDSWMVDEIKLLHQSLLSRILVMALQQRKIEVDSAKIEALLTILGGNFISRVSLDARWDVAIVGKYLQWLQKPGADGTMTLPDFEVAVRIPGLTPISGTGKGLQIEELESSAHSPSNSFPAAGALEALVDLNNFHLNSNLPIVLRRRQAGDFIQPLGMTEMVRLKQYLHARKANRLAPALAANFERGYLVSQCIILASGQEVLWVPGIGLSERVKVKLNTRPTHRLSIVDLFGETK
jgi:tRNA(Ile)-lysidine synthetase-like protein